MNYKIKLKIFLITICVREKLLTFLLKDKEVSKNFVLFSYKKLLLGS